jgi:putative membrane protein
MATQATKTKHVPAAVKETARAVEQQSRKVADSAQELTHSSARIEDSADRTTQLAADRTILAAERTYAAWVRTGLLALAGGIGARALSGMIPEWLILANGTMLIGFSLFCFAAAVWRHLHPGPPPPVPDVERIPGAALIAVNVLLSVVAVASLAVLWMAGPR